MTVHDPMVVAFASNNTKFKRMRLTIWHVMSFGALCFIGLIALSLVLPESSARRFSSAYGKLELGVSAARVEDLFESPPEYIWKFDAGEIWYYRSPGWFVRPPKNLKVENGALIGSVDQLPDIYGYVQLAFDSSGRLYAYTWIGEEYFVHYPAGTVRGSNVSKLGDKLVLK